jgi:dihydrofolate synthase/folylpolyglutamate synthase
VPCFDDVTQFLYSLIRPGLRPYAERAPHAQASIRRLLSILDNPQDGLPVVHIAGSKGKGSTALILERILRGCGYRVGTYTSPHLQHWGERIRIDGSAVPNDALASAVAILEPEVEALTKSRPTDPPSFFDVITAAGLHLFRESAVDYAIVEAGLGGRYDATNVVAPRLCCITTVELEHTDKLGESLADIAWHKAGIIKAGVPVVCGPLPEEAAQVVREHAAAANAPLRMQSIYFQVETQALPELRQQIDYHSEALHLQAALAHPAPAVAENAALAIACAECLGAAPPERLQEQVRAALSDVALPARMEIFCREPWILIDGGHTPAAIEALAGVIRAIGATQLRLAVSVSDDKHGALLAPLLDTADQVLVTSAEPLRSVPAEALAAEIRTHTDAPVLTVADPAEALEHAAHNLPPDGLICVTGSMYLAGIARKIFAAKAIPTIRGVD